MTGLTHLDGEGRARMVDVSGKPATRREAEASAFVMGEFFRHWTLLSYMETQDSRRLWAAYRAARSAHHHRDPFARGNMFALRRNDNVAICARGRG